MDHPQPSAIADELSPLLLESSQPFVGRWNQMVSTTNWEKGRIIFQWRQALIDSEADATEYSDEAWGRLVGGVTGQHVGRLRRVYQRFGENYTEYEGLYWSHFQAALDWEDAEMWLEGSVQNTWSVSQMRGQRWETTGGDEKNKPHDEEIVTGELDEDFEPAVNREPIPNTISPSMGDVESRPLAEGPDFGDEEHSGKQSGAEPAETAASYADQHNEAVDTVRPFENLAVLPDDLAEAFETYKLAILHHKTEGWEQISRADVLAGLDALKELVIAPSAE